MIQTKIDDLTAEIRLIPTAGQFTLLDVDTIKEIIRQIRYVRTTHVKTVRIFGEGGCFAVGADLKSLSTYGGFEAKWFSRLGNTLFGLIRTMPQTVIAEIDGFCMGGGMDFSAACDFRFATARSKFAHPGAKLGIITGFGGTQGIPRLMTSSGANEFLITGNTFDAEYMKRNGFLTGVASGTDELRHMTHLFCVKVNSKPRHLLYSFKASLESSATLI